MLLNVYNTRNHETEYPVFKHFSCIAFGRYLSPVYTMVSQNTSAHAILMANIKAAR